MSTSVFSKQLQQLRKERGMTQEQLAERVGVSPQAVSKWENGSYPDGELLPVIAREFNVSIDLLYGIGKTTLSTEQHIVDAISDIVTESENMNFGDVYDKMLDYAWAMIIPCVKDNHDYIPRKDGKRCELRTESLAYSKDGFINMRHNDDLQYAFIMKKPECGYEEYLGPDKKTGELFTFLSDEANLKVLYYLETLKDNELVVEKSLSAVLDISAESARSAVAFLMENGYLNKMILEENGKSINVYSFRHNWGFMMLLTGAKSMMHWPEAYRIQVSDGNREIFDRKRLGFVKN